MLKKNLHNSDDFFITENSKCTGCGLCSVVCPKKCIRLVPNYKGEMYPHVNNLICIRCNKCVSKCPQNQKSQFNLPKKAFAGWSLEKEIRNSAASGGIASSIYRYCISKNMRFAGVFLNSDYTAQFKLGSAESDIMLFKGSKYVYSSMGDVFLQIKQEIDEGGKVVFIGLPCQVEAIKTFFPGCEDLIYIDIVCHGVCSSKYLIDHIKSLVPKKRVKKVNFRDPRFGTEKFIFSLYDENDTLLYKKSVDKNDVYQLAYHKALSYRENCYHCKYARPERVSDITIGDYWGLGKIAPYYGERKNVSLILCNTDKGITFINKLCSSGHIQVIERPVDEPLKTEKQLKQPSQKTDLQSKLNSELKKSDGNFELAAQKVLRKKIIMNYVFPVSIRRFIRKFI